MRSAVFILYIRPPLGARLNVGKPDRFHTKVYGSCMYIGAVFRTRDNTMPCISTSWTKKKCNLGTQAL